MTHETGTLSRNKQNLGISGYEMTLLPRYDSSLAKINGKKLSGLFLTFWLICTEI